MASVPTPGRLLRKAQLAAPRHALLEWHSLSVVRFDDGSARAFHNRLDMGTRRLIAQRLCDPSDSVTGLPWAILALTNAAEELEVAHRMNQGLW
jgi:hypothetical protein